MPQLAPESSILEMWQRHVLECRACGQARTGTEMCQIGQNFWRIPTSASMPVQGQPQFQGAQPQAPAMGGAPPGHGGPAAQAGGGQAFQMPVAPVLDINALASRVAERIVVRTSSGASIAMPMEKTSKLIEFSPSSGVVLRMPERDIEVYSVMRSCIVKFLRFAERVGTCMLATEEAKRMTREQGITLGEKEVALVVQYVSDRRGIGNISLEALYEEFEEVARIVVRLGDAMGRLMGHDSDTRAVIKESRSLGVEMQSEIERAAGRRLVLDNDMRQIVRKMRMLAVSLQTEMDRRLGTA